MATPMTSRERLLTALRRGQPDRVPITLYEVDPYLDRHWQGGDPSYDRVRQVAREMQDTVSFARIPVGRFLSDPHREERADAGAATTRTWEEDGATFTETSIPTPNGRVLTAVSRLNPGVHSSWRVKSFVEDEADLEAFLSLPYTPAAPDLSDVDAAERELGEHGLITFSLGDPLGVMLGVIPFDLFAEWSATEADRKKVLRLLDVMHERTYRLVEHLTAHSRQRAFRFWGPEYAGPSLMPPSRFKDYVVDYLADIVQLVQRSGNYALIHCHARLDAILEMIGGLEPDALEPIECIPAPSADVTLADVKRRIGDHVCLMGNIQGPLLETGAPEDVDRAVQQAVDEGAAGGGFILMPTAMPVTALDARMEANILTFMEAARKYGAY